MRHKSYSCILLTYLYSYRLGLDDLRTNNYTPSEAIFSGLYAYHVATNTWTKLRDDCSGNSTGPQDIKSRIGHSMLFHSVSFYFVFILPFNIRYACSDYNHSSFRWNPRCGIDFSIHILLSMKIYIMLLFFSFVFPFSRGVGNFLF